MSIIGIRGTGSNDDTIMQVDPTYDAGRFSLRPIETQTDQQGVLGGHYRIAGQSGLMAAGIASAAQVFQVRWADPSKLFGLKMLKVQASTCTGFAATTIGAPLQLWIGHGSTANGSGGAAIAPTNGNKSRNGHANTAFSTSGEIRLATTAALTAPTGQALEAAAFSGCMGAPNATLAQSPEMYLFDQRDNGDHPLILSTSDTLAILTLNPAATGTWTFTVTMTWFEAVQY